MKELNQSQLDLSNNTTGTIIFDIVVSIKKDIVGRNRRYRVPPNYEEILEKVANYLNQTIIFVDFMTLSLLQQIHLVMNTRLLVSIAGGSAFIGLFLSQGASMLLFSDTINDRYLDFGFFSAFSHIEVSYILTTRRSLVVYEVLLPRICRLLVNTDLYSEHQSVRTSVSVSVMDKCSRL